LPHKKIINTVPNLYTYKHFTNTEWSLDEYVFGTWFRKYSRFVVLVILNKMDK